MICRSHAAKPLLRPHGTYVSTEWGPRAQNPLLAIATLGRRQRVMFPIPRVRKSDADTIEGGKALSVGRSGPCTDARKKLAGPGFLRVVEEVVRCRLFPYASI